MQNTHVFDLKEPLETERRYKKICMVREIKLGLFGAATYKPKLTYVTFLSNTNYYLKLTYKLYV